MSRLTPIEVGPRIACVVVALTFTLVLAVSRFLTPDPRGFGTHEQLGLLPCSTMQFFGIPCPFCGMTTTFVLMARGNHLSAITTQPVGALLFCLLFISIPTLVLIAVVGRTPVIRLKARYAWIGIASLLLAGWLYKIMIFLQK